MVDTKFLNCGFSNAKYHRNASLSYLFLYTLPLISYYVNSMYPSSALKGKYLYILPFLGNLLYQHFRLKNLKLSTSFIRNCSLLKKNVYKFSISSWQTSPSLINLYQFRTALCSSVFIISSVSVSCWSKLANNSEDIFFCNFFIPFFSKKKCSYSCFIKSAICSIR